jgi:glycerol-3-phosphate dehydrogenase subunit B
LPALQQRNFTAPAILALLMEREDFQAEVAAALSPHLKKASRIGFPAVLGQKPNLKVINELEKRLGRTLFEIPALTPSVPGMRLQQILVSAVRSKRGRVTPGIEATGSATEDGTVTAVNSMIPGRTVAHRADHYILATGGILGGGITTDYQGNISETVFGLPLSAPGNHTEWFHLDFLDRRGHPIYRSGINVNNRLQPLNGKTAPLYDNLFAVGTTLAHAEVIRERSFEGVAISTAYAAAGML